MAAADKPIINPNLIVTSLVADSAENVISALGALLVEHGYTDADYVQKVVEREKVYATGLPTNPPVAIPHADAGLAATPGIAVGLLAEPVPFIVMGTEDQVTNVEFVFMLAVTDPQAQVIWLKSLIEFVQDASHLNQLSGLVSHSAPEVAKFLEAAISIPET